MNNKPAIFEDYKIRRLYDEQSETWYFSVVDIIQALLQQPDFQTARKYWNKLKERLNKEGSESVTKCHRLKLNRVFMVKMLLLARHATVDSAFADRYIGASDIGLGPDHGAEIRSLSVAIKPFSPTAMLSSPLSRTRQTAEGLAAELAFPPQAIGIMPELREIDFGRWEGRSFPEIAAADPDLVEAWAAWSEDFQFPQGERIGDFLARVQEATRKILQLQDEKVLLVTHGGVIRAMICLLLGLAPQHYLLFDIKPASLALLKIFDDRGLLLGLNLGRQEVG